MLRRAFLAKSSPLVRLFQAAQDLPADANRGFLSRHSLDSKNAFSIEVTEVVSKFVAALWNETKPAPCPICHVKDLAEEVLGPLIAEATDGATILIFQLGVSCF